MRFSLIDRVTEVTPGERIAAVKTLACTEEYLADHFPGFPVMPGVLMVEAMTQASAWLVRVTDDFAHSCTELTETRAVKFNAFLVPGETLRITATVLKRDGLKTVVKATGVKAKSDGGEEACVSGKLTLTCSNLADAPAPAPNAADRDARARDELRARWAELHRPG